MAKNILICDDAAFMRMMIKNVLTKGGYNVAGRERGEGSGEIQGAVSGSGADGHHHA